MSYNILLADDNKDFREEIKYMLKDYNIIEASNGEEALKTLEKNDNIDLAILDEKMPEKSGTKVLKNLKELNPKIKVIILTGFSTEKIVIDAIKGHADDYLEKIKDLNKLTASVKNLLKIKEIKEIQKSLKTNICINSMNKREKVNLVKKIMERNIDKILSLEYLAKEIYLSPKYLSKIFKEVTGENIINYRLNQKVEKAKELLMLPDKRIENIAYDLGYKKFDSFNKIFKERTGYTLSEYKNKKGTKEA